ncbi:MAG: hypothetical protein ACLRNQ_02510 [Flavonifractor plautii]
MTVRELTEALSLTPFHLAQPDRPVSGGYAGDLLSWVLGRAGQDAAWLTIMSNQNVAAVALMAEVSCVILTEGSPPTATCSAALRRRASICWGPDRIPLTPPPVCPGRWPPGNASSLDIILLF